MSESLHDEFSVIYDLDDTLFYTKDAVIESYRRAGVLMPEAMFGRPWQEWLPTVLDDSLQSAAIVHARKNRIYLDMIDNNEIAVTPAHTLFRNSANTVVITGASREPAAALLGANLDYRLALTQASWRDKAHYLATSSTICGVYVDDDEKLGRRIVHEANCLRGVVGMDAPFTLIHYTGQSAQELGERIQECRER